ncbi:MAG: DUF4184 family protein [Terriglobales bacterium]
MPFTLSHPAAVAPLYSTRLPLSALVIGSMAPDFEYFIRMAQQGRSAHTWPGVLYLTFPFAWFALAAFHLLLKWPVISLMPGAWQRRMVPPARKFRWWPFGHLLLALAGVAVGIATHLLWDAFTHEEGWGVRHWSALRLMLFHVGPTRITVWKLAQHGSTLLGAIVILLYVLRWYRNAPQSEQRLPVRLSPAANLMIVAVCAFAAVGLGLARGLSQWTPGPGLSPWQHLAASFAVTSVTVAVLELVIFSVLWHLVIEKRQRTRRFRAHVSAD